MIIPKKDLEVFLIENNRLHTADGCFCKVVYSAAP